jgi:hypothetical protein
MSSSALLQAYSARARPSNFSVGAWFRNRMQVILRIVAASGKEQ